MIPEALLQPRFQLTLSAASGAVLRGGVLYVVGDDRGALDRFAWPHGTALAPVPLLDGSVDAVLPKRDKPDLEALADLGSRGLFALGSGSRDNRCRGFLVRDGSVRGIDLSPLYARLRAAIPDLNIEGAALHAGVLMLAHRGVGRGDASCLLEIDAAAIDAGRLPAEALIAVRPVDLGSLDGVALAFTDLAAGPDGALYYIAAAEDTSDPYLDGPCRGSVIGRIDAQGRARVLARLSPAVKAEGLAYSHAENGTDVWLVVTDADDPGLRAGLYELRLKP